MSVATTDGRRVELDVERLSIEQRQGLLSAIVSYGGLVEEEQTPPDEPMGEVGYGLRVALSSPVAMAPEYVPSMVSPSTFSSTS